MSGAFFSICINIYFTEKFHSDKIGFVIQLPLEPLLIHSRVKSELEILENHLDFTTKKDLWLLFYCFIIRAIDFVIGHLLKDDLDTKYIGKPLGLHLPICPLSSCLPHEEII